MAKNKKKWLALLAAGTLALGMCAFAACAPGTEDTDKDPDTDGDVVTVDWSAYTQDQWIAEIDKFEGKQIDYQFNSTDFTQRNSSAMLNLYSDGSACADHFTPGRTEGDMYVGYWSEAEDEDGNAISITIVAGYGTGINGTTYSEKNKSYPSIYELNNGDYSFSMDVDLAMGQYTRQLSMLCDNTVKYTTFAAFEEAAEANAPQETPDDGEEETIPEGAFAFEYISDSSSDLKDTMVCKSSEWGVKLGTDGSYTATDSADLLITFTGGFTKLECYADGTYKFMYEKVSLTESGTWTFSGWVMTFTTAGGQTFTCSPAE